MYSYMEIQEEGLVLTLRKQCFVPSHLLASPSCYGNATNAAGSAYTFDTTFRKRNNLGLTIEQVDSLQG